MAREGEHNAQLKVQGDTQSGVKEMRQLAAQMNGFEKQVERTNASLSKFSQKQKQAENDMTKWGKETMEVRGRMLGMAGALAAAAIGVDRLMARSRELAKAQGINAGLAFDWGEAVDSLVDDFDDLVLAINNISPAVRAAAEEIGLLSDASDDASSAAESGVSAWDKYAIALGAFGIIAKASLGLLDELAAKVNALSPKLAKSGLGPGMDILKMRAEQLQGKALTNIMERQNADMQRSIEMLEANARSAEIVEDHLDRFKPKRRTAKATKFGEAFEFTPEARAEMQGGTGLGSQIAGEDEKSLRESQDAFIEARMEFRQRELEVDLEADLQRIAQREELGILEPIDALALERDAQIEHLEAMRGFTSDRNELQRITNQQEAIYHQARMKRIELERQAELKRWRTTSEIAAATAQITQGGIATASMAADMFIASEKRREQAMYVTGGVSALVTGIEQQVQAIAAFASFNYVQGALHQAAAIFAFVQSGMLFAKAGGAGSHSGGIGAGGGAIGGGPTAAANGPANGRGGEGLQNQIQSDVPPSQAPTASGPRRGEGLQQGTVIQIAQLNAYATTQDEFIQATARELDYLRRDVRRVS